MRYSPLLSMAALAALTIGCGERAGFTQPSISSSAPAFARASRSSVSGHIERDFSELGVPVEKFSFHAHYLGNGQVEGQYRLIDFSAGGSKEVARGRVICFTVEADGRTARIGAINEAGTNPANIGFYALWTVVDNGEGANAPPDQATDLRFGPSLPAEVAVAHCEEGFLPEAFGTFGESIRANVQVRP
jgi:hypothetical protein